MTERLDRIEVLLEGHGLAMADLRARQEVMQQQQERIQQQQERTQQQIDSNAKAIEAAGNQQAADRDLARADRERYILLRDETREDIRELAALMREDRERNLIQEREIRMQSGEIQNLADSIQHLYSRQPPPS